jgi:hypothetical protein
MTTHHDPLQLRLTDLDRVLPPGYSVLLPGDPRNDHPHAVRVVWNDATAQTHSFTSAQAYLQFVVSVAPRSRLSEEGGTCYLLLSAQYDADPWFHASVTHTVAALTRSSVILHRLKSDETSVRFVLTREEMRALIEGYQASVPNREQEEAASDIECDPFLADITYERER